MNHSHVQHSNHILHDHTLQPESVAIGHNHLNTSDHHSMMKMYFHTGLTETILFDSWKTTHIPIFIGSCVFIFILAILYEGIRELRQYLADERLIKRPILQDDGNENELEHMNKESPESTIHVVKKIPTRYPERVLQSILYLAQLVLGYILMLIAMTFNIYLFLAIIFGIGTGHLLYTWSRLIPSTRT